MPQILGMHWQRRGALKDGVSLGSLALDLDGEDTEQNDLHGGARRIPATAKHANSKVKLCSRACSVRESTATKYWKQAAAAARQSQHRQVGNEGAPEGAGDAVLPGDVGRLQQGGGPGPVRHDVDGDQAGLDGAPGAVELLAGSARAAKPVVAPNVY